MTKALHPAIRALGPTIHVQVQVYAANDWPEFLVQWRQLCYHLSDYYYEQLVAQLSVWHIYEPNASSSNPLMPLLPFSPSCGRALIAFNRTKQHYDRLESLFMT